MQEIASRNGFKIGTLPNSLVLVRVFLYHNVVFGALYMICEIYVFCKNLVHEIHD